MRREVSGAGKWGCYGGDEGARACRGSDVRRTVGINDSGMGRGAQDGWDVGARRRPRCDVKSNSDGSGFPSVTVRLWMGRLSFMGVRKLKFESGVGEGVFSAVPGWGRNFWGLLPHA
eukprot:3039436-Rhodomonas_salina.1